MFRNKRLLISVILGGLLLVGGTAYGTLMFVQHSSLYNHWFSAQPDKLTLSAKPLFKPMDKFVITLEGEDGLHYLMLEVSLVTHDSRQLDVFTELTPVLRNAVVHLFSRRSNQQVNADLRDLDKLQLQLAEKLRATLQNYGEEPALDDVLITKVVVQ
jgi:flagellar protein FliL